MTKYLTSQIYEKAKLYQDLYVGIKKVLCKYFPANIDPYWRLNESWLLQNLTFFDNNYISQIDLQKLLDKTIYAKIDYFEIASEQVDLQECEKFAKRFDLEYCGTAVYNNQYYHKFSIPRSKLELLATYCKML